MDDEAALDEILDARSSKEELVASVLARWWYVLPEWPPRDYDYANALARNKLRLVSFQNWEAEDDVDQEGRTKVYEITNFPGVYRDANGRAIDLRPIDGKPSYNNLAKLSETQLTDLLRQALTKQIQELQESPYKNTDYKYILKLKRRLEELFTEQTG